MPVRQFLRRSFGLWSDTGTGMPVPRKAVFEEIEARLLYSADLAPGISDVAGAEIRVIDNTQETPPDSYTDNASSGVTTQNSQYAQQLVFVDSSVADADKLLADVRSGNPAAEIIFISSDRDGISQISEALAGRSNISAIHLITHGSAGALQIGNTVLDNSTLAAHQTAISAWQTALTADADLLLYGCDLAGSADGRALANSLAVLTGADVAASDDLTGNSAAGGDWSLEYATGNIETSLAIDATTEQWAGTLAVTLNGTTSSAATSTAGATSLSFSHTVEAGSNRILMVSVAARNDIPADSVTYGGQPLTQLSTVTYIGTVTADIWYLLNPTVGTANVVVNVVSTHEYVAGATTFNGVHQTTSFGTVATNGFGGSDSSLSVESASGDMVIDVLATQSQTDIPAVGANQTTLWGQSVGTSSADPTGASSYEIATGATTTMSWSSIDNFPPYAAIGVALKAAPNTAPVITSNGGGATAAVNVAENTTAVTTVTATDADGNTLTYSISGGADAAKFTINSSTGVLSFVSAPDYETPTDVDSNNVYDLVVTVSDGSLTDTQNIAVTVTDVVSTLIVDTAADTNDSGLGASFNAEQLNASKGTDGKISLREAIIAANTTAGTDTISFNMAGAGVHTISLTSALPTITGVIVIDGYTQTGASANTLATGNDATLLIELDGTSAGAGVNGLSLAAGSDGSTIRGLIINSFTDDGIDINTSNNNTITGNFIGTNAAGTAVSANAASGMIIFNSANNTIGGSSAALRNVISGNGYRGIDLTGNTTTSNTILGNFIGTNAAGTAALANSGDGVLVQNSAWGNTIGGTTASARNVISGNGGSGVTLSGATVHGNIVQGNYLGLNAAGNAGIGNTYVGAYMWSAYNNMIGGTAAGAGNVISANATGIVVQESSATGNSFLGNSVYSNSGLGIDLGWDGITANDALDSDPGANSLQNFPVITSATTNTSGSVRVTGTFNGTASTTYRLEFFSTATGDGGGYGEAQTYLGTTSVTTDGSGNASFNALFSATVPLNYAVTGTATVDLGGGSYGSTSEFAQNATTSNTAPVINSNGGGASASISVAENTTAVTTVVASDADTWDTITYSISGGADAAKFTINSSTGVLSFVSAPDYETPTDVGGNNVYDLVVTVSDGSLTDTQSIAVTVTDVVSTLIVDTAADTNDSGLGASFNAEQLNASKGTDGKISLREAIIAANTTAGTDTISFNMAGAGVHTISLTSALPTITGVIVIDGYTQTGASANTLATGNDATLLIELDGTSAGAGVNGLSLAAGSDGSTIRGLIINSFTDDGIDIFNSNNNTITGNFIGINAAGTAASANAAGVFVFNGSNTTIGGSSAALRNVISGNSLDAILLWGGSNNNILGNFIGTNAAGTAGLANGYAAVGLLDTWSNTIGGTTAGARNVIVSHSNNYGVALVGATTHSNIVQGNYIGLNAAGNASIGDLFAGVYISEAYNNTIGGTTAGAGNLISGSGPTGILALESSATGNGLLGNSIYNYSGLGIDLSYNGVTANDAGDADIGPNNLQNFPVITAATTNTTDSARFVGTLNSNANTTYRIEFFSDAAANGFSAGAGQTFLSATTITTDASGNASFDVLLSATIAAGTQIRATATVDLGGGNYGSTSEFAQNATTSNTAPVISSNGGGASASISAAENTTAVTTVVASDADTWDTVTYSISGGADSALFSINASTGVLTFNTARNYESPADANTDNVYEVTVQVSDGSLTDTQAISVTVTATNDNTPVITSNGGAATAAVSIAENTTAVTTVTSTDADADVGATAAYSIIGGADAALFVIDSSTGALSFVSAPNRESASDADANNVYEVSVQVSDGSDTDTQAISVTVNDLNEFNVSTVSDSNGSTNAVAENTINGTRINITASATDADATTNTVSYALSDDAGGRFAIDSSTGLVTIANGSLLDYESSTAHTITVQATSADGSSSTQSFSIAIANINEAPSIAAPAALSGTQEQALAVSGISLGDPEGNINFVNLNVSRGTLTVSLAGGAAIAGGSNGSASLTLSGSQAALDNALASLVYTGGSGFAGTDQLNLTASDTNGLVSSSSVQLQLVGVTVTPEPEPTPPPAPTPEPETPAEPPTPRAPDVTEDLPAPLVVTPAPAPAEPVTRPEVTPETQPAKPPPNTATLANSGIEESSNALVLATQDEIISTLRKLDQSLGNTRTGMVSEPLSLNFAPSQADHNTFDNLLRLSPTQAGKAATAVFTAGVVWWAGRSAGLIAALMASVPAWRVVDPLPILARDRKRRKEHELSEDDNPPTLNIDRDMLTATQPDRLMLMDTEE